MTNEQPMPHGTEGPRVDQAGRIGPRARAAFESLGARGRDARGAAVKVRVRLFASAREAVGRGEVEAELGEGATVAQLLEALGAAHPRRAPPAPPPPGGGGPGRRGGG